MIHYAIANSGTGIIEPDCPYCGLQAATQMSDFENHRLPPNHVKVLLTPDDFTRAHEIDQSQGRYKYKIDKNAKKLVRHE